MKSSQREKFWFRVVMTIFIVYFFTHVKSTLSAFSRIYEKGFIACHYQYASINDSEYVKELSFSHKMLCKKEYYTALMAAFLKDLDHSKCKMITNRDNTMTSQAWIGDVHVIVKSKAEKGFFWNLLFLSRGCNIWNNAHWVKELDVPTLKPIALVEKRTWNESDSFVVYLFEGKCCEDELKKDRSFFSKLEDFKQLLIDKNIVHHDYRLRNLVVLDDGSLQMIDIDKLHYYNYPTPVFRARWEREVRLFNSNMEFEVGINKQIQRPFKKGLFAFESHKPQSQKKKLHSENSSHPQGVSQGQCRPL